MSSFTRRTLVGGATLCVLVLAVGAGCSKSSSSDYDASVQGTVTIDGELASGGTVTFIPVKGGPAAVGMIAANGSYALRIGQGNASDPDRSMLPSGKYVATVVVTAPPAMDARGEDGGPLPIGPRLMADKYASQETSEMEYEVAKGLNVFDLKLEGAWANPPSDEEADEQQGEEGEGEAAESAGNEEADVDSTDEALDTSESAAAEATSPAKTPAAAATDGDQPAEDQP